jgi:hypothetical protein
MWSVCKKFGVAGWLMGGCWDQLAMSTILSQNPGPKAGVMPGMGVGLVLSHILMQAPVYQTNFL